MQRTPATERAFDRAAAKMLLSFECSFFTSGLENVTIAARA
jgi:hypothetical protein